MRFPRFTHSTVSHLTNAFERFHIYLYVGTMQGYERPQRRTDAQGGEPRGTALLIKCMYIVDSLNSLADASGCREVVDLTVEGYYRARSSMLYMGMLLQRGTRLMGCQDAKAKRSRVQENHEWSLSTCEATFFLLQFTTCTRPDW